jgi:putative copper export protein/methionine-rich copper-binding protein CopC
MMSSVSRLRQHGRRCRLAHAALLTLTAALCAPPPAAAHVELVASAPGRGAVLDAPPPELRLRFSGWIERRYTRVSLVAPDGHEVPLGPVTFVAGSDREVTAALPPVALPGTYTVQWRTTGADGHVLEGRFTFVLAAETTADDPVVTPPPPRVEAHDHDPEDREDAAPGTASGAGVAPVLARGLHFSALVLLLGAMTFRLLLLPRLGLAGAATHETGRRLWRHVSVAAILLAVAAVLRLGLQSVALHGTDRAWTGALVGTMLTDTAWGRAWLAQAFFLAALTVGILRARPGSDRGALMIAGPAALALSAIPALTGHAAGVGGLAWLAVLNDAAHVTAAGAWFGTLFLLLLVLPPVLAHSAADRHRAMGEAVDRFSPLALGAAAVLVVTGAINGLMHVTAVRQLAETEYGTALLVKLGFFALVLAAGFYNWKVVRPRLAGRDAASRLRTSAGLELGLAAAVLLVTAVLTGLPRP